jgi:hypothetical protein
VIIELIYAVAAVGLAIFMVAALLRPTNSSSVQKIKDDLAMDVRGWGEILVTIAITVALGWPLGAIWRGSGKAVDLARSGAEAGRGWALLPPSASIRRRARTGSPTPSPCWPSAPRASSSST